MKWYFLFVAAMLVWLAYANLNGQRILGSGNQEQWSSSGSSSHRTGIMHHK